MVWNAAQSGYTAVANDYPVTSDPYAYYVALRQTSGHPGNSNAQSVSYDIFVIAAYKVDRAGPYTLHDSVLSVGFNNDGVEVRIYVNNKLVNLVDIDAVQEDYAPIVTSGTFDTFLGYLNVNDVVYVCVGPNRDNYADTFSMDYTISIGMKGKAEGKENSWCGWC